MVVVHTGLSTVSDSAMVRNVTVTNGNAGA